MISQRLRGLSEDGEAVDGLLPKLEKQFASVGISIQDQNGDLRSSFKILQDLAGVWDQLSSKQKQYFGEKVAGNRQVKTLNAIMQNWDVVADTIDKANNSQGAALEGNEMYMDSIAGKITELKSAWQELANTTISGDFVKGFVEIGTAVVKLTTNIGGLAPVLATILGLFVAIKGANIAEAFTKIGSAIVSAISGIGSASTILSGWIGIAIAAAGAIYGIVNAIRNASVSLKDLEAASNKAKSNYSEQQATLSGLNDELSTTQEKISELEGKTLSIVEEDELAALKEQNNELQRKIDLQNELTRIAERQAREAAVNTINAKNNATKEGKTINGITDNLYDTLGIDYLSNYNFKDYEVYQGSIRGQVQVPSAGRVSNRELADLYMAALPKQIQKRDKYQKALSIYSKSLMQEGEFTEEAIEAAQKNANLWSDYAQESEEWLRNYYDYLQEQTEGISYVENAKVGSIDAQYNEMLALKDQVGEALMTNFVAGQDYKGQFDYITNLEKFKDQVKEISEEIKNTGTIDLKELKVKFPDLIEEFKKYGWTPEKVHSYMEELFSGEAFEVSPSFNINLEDFKLFTSTDSYKNITSALSEQQKSGALSFETMQTLMNDSSLQATAGDLEGIAACLERTANGYALNTEKVNEYVNALNKEKNTDATVAIMERQIQVKKLQEELASLTEEEKAAGREAEIIGEINGINAQILQFQAAKDEIEAATDALNKYREASKTPNQDAEHTEGRGVWDAIKEGYKSGKVGTDDFKQGMGFFLGENWQKDFENDVDAAYKAAKQKRDRYFGDDDLKSAQNFAKDVGDLEIGGEKVAEYDAATGKLTMLTDESGNAKASLEELAAAMGMSESAVASLFGLLNSYSLTDQITFDDTISSVEELEAAEKRLQELDEQRKQLEKEIAEAEESGDTSGLEEKKNALEDLNSQYGDLKSAIDTANESMEEGKLDTSTLSIEEAIEKLGELTTAMDTLEANGITVPVELSGDFQDLVDFLSGTNKEGEYEISVNEIGDAQQKLNEIQAIREKIEANPDIPSNIKAEIEGNLDEQADALNEYISQAETIQSEFPGGNVAATITCDATTNGMAQISWVDSQLFGNDGLDGKTAEVTLEATDNNASANAQTVSDAVDGIPPYKNTQITVGNISAISKIGEVIDALPETLDTTVNAITEAAENAVSEFVKNNDGKTITVKVNTVDLGGKIDEPPEGRVPKTESQRRAAVQKDLDEKNTTIGAKKNDSGKYEYVDPNKFIQGVIKGLWNSNGGSMGPGELQSQAEAQIQQRLNDGTLMFSENINDLSSAISVALETLNQNKLADPEYFDDPNNPDYVEPIEPVEIPTEIDEGELQDQIEDAADGAKPESKVKPNVDDFGEEIDEATPDEESEITAAGLGEYTESIHDATPDSETVTINEKVVPDGDEVPEDTSISYEGTVTLDDSSAVNRVESLDQSISGDHVMPVDADTSSGESKVESLDEKASKSQTKNVLVKVLRSALDTLLKDLAEDITLNVKVKYTEENKPGEIPGRAVGTKNATNGISLVDEKGAELIEHVSRGTYELGTNDGPRFTKLDKGDVVHTASETRKILNRFNGIGGLFSEGLNKAKSIIGGAFRTGVSGSATIPTISSSSKKPKKQQRKSGSSSDSIVSKTASDMADISEWAEKLFDWVEIRLQRLQEATDTILYDASNIVSLGKKNSRFDDANKAVSTQIKANQKAKKKYTDTAWRVANQAGLSKDIIKKIKNGTIDVASYSKETQDAIREYQEWYEKAVACTEAIRDLKEQQKELAEQKLDNIVNTYSAYAERAESRLSYEDARREYYEVTGLRNVNGKSDNITTINDSISTSITDATQRRSYLQKERKYINERLNKEIKAGRITKGDETWNKYKKMLIDLDTEIVTLSTDIQKFKQEANQIKIDNFQHEVDNLNSTTDITSKTMELYTARGSKSILNMKSFYEDLIQTTTDEIETIKQQSAIYREMQKSMDPLSEKYQELQKKINDNESALYDNRIQIQNYKDAISQLKITDLSYQFDELSDNASKASNAIDLSLASGKEITSDNYQALIDNGNAQINNINDRKAAYEALMETMVKQYGEEAKQSEKYIEYADKIRELEAAIEALTISIIEWRKSIAQIEIDKLGWEIDSFNQSIEATNAQLELWKAQGSRSIESTFSSYTNLIDLTTKENASLQDQINLYKEQQKGLDKNSELYQELQDKIDDNTLSILNNKKAIQDYIDERNNIVIERNTNTLETLADEAEKYNDAISLKNVSGKRVVGADYENLIKNGNKQIEVYKNQKQVYQEMMQAMVDAYGNTAKSSEKYHEYANYVRDAEDAIRELNEKLIEWNRSIKQLGLDKLAWDLDKVAASAERMNNKMSLHEAQNYDETSAAYKSLIDNGMQQIKILEEENRLYKEMQSGMSEYSELYQELQSKINSNLSEIENMKVSQEEWNDAIIDLGINNVQKFRDALSKTNDEYQRQKTLQEAIQDLEKANYQRKVRTYVEGEGFVYQASADDIKSAQERLEDVVTDQLLGKIDDLIDALEESKGDSNVYDASGNLIGQKYTVPNIGSIEKILSDYRDNNVAKLDIDVLKDSLGKTFASSIGTTENNSATLNIGDIIVNEANDGNELAKTIIEQFPTALLQALYKK